MRKALIFVVAAVLLALGGCGGSSESTMSKQEFTAQLKQTCQSGAEARQALLQHLSKEYYEERASPPTNEYQAENLRKLMAIIQNTTDEIAAIGLPEGEEKKVEEWIRARQEAAAKVEASPLGTRDNLQEIFESANAQSQALGVGTCDL